MKKQELEEIVPCTNLTTGTWIKLLLKLPDNIMKHIQKRQDAEEFSCRLLHARFNKQEINKFEKALNPYKDDERYENIDMPKPNVIEEFLKIIDERKQKRKMLLLLDLSDEELKYLKKLIPYGITIISKFIDEKITSVMLNNEGIMYLTDITRGHNPTDILKMRIRRLMK